MKMLGNKEILIKVREDIIYVHSTLDNLDKQLVTIIANYSPMFGLSNQIPQLQKAQRQLDIVTNGIVEMRKKITAVESKLIKQMKS